jgi:hypothetical protein
MAEKVETVTLRGLRFVVAVLRDEDIEAIAQRVAILLSQADARVVAEDLRREHARQVPASVIEAEAALIEQRRREASE